MCVTSTNLSDSAHASAVPQPPQQLRWTGLSGLSVLSILRLLLAAALGCAVLPVAIADTPALTPVVIATGSSVPATVLFVADEMGYFAQEGLAVKFDHCIGASRCIDNVFEGKAQFAAVGDLALMFNSIEHQDFTVLATYATSTSMLKLITRKSAHISKAQDLIGKRVGMPKKSAPHYFLDNFLLFEGVDPKLVEHVFVDLDGMSAALASGKVDALSTFEPLASRQRAALGKDAFDLTVPPYNLSTHLVASRKTVAQSHADTVKVLKAMDKAVQYIAREPLKAKAILAKHSGLDAAGLDSLWTGSQFKLVLDPSLQVTLNSAARWAKNENLINEGQFPDFSEFINAEPLTAARSKGTAK